MLSDGSTVTVAASTYREDSSYLPAMYRFARMTCITAHITVHFSKQPVLASPDTTGPQTVTVLKDVQSWPVRSSVLAAAVLPD